MEVRARRTYNMTGKPFIEVTFSPDGAGVRILLLPIGSERCLRLPALRYVQIDPINMEAPRP